MSFFVLSELISTPEANSVLVFLTDDLYMPYVISTTKPNGNSYPAPKA
jgi:hypothetical protein